MPFLLTVFGIIVFFVLVLSIRVTVLIEYKEYIELQVKWLFLKFNLLPIIEKKSDEKTEAQGENKEKTNSEAVPEPEPVTVPKPVTQTADIKKEEKKEEASVTEPAFEKEEISSDGVKLPSSKDEAKKAVKPAAKPPSILKDLWEAHGYDGLVKMLKDSVDALNKFLGNTLKAIIIDELYYTMRVSKPDAAETAIEYGKVCAELYPLFGSIISRLKTRKYDINIYPDYIAYKNEMHLQIKLLVIPRKVLNAAIAFAMKLLFKVVLKVLIKLLRKPKEQSKINNKKSKGGAF